MSPAKSRKPFQGREIVTLRDHFTLAMIERVLNVVQFYYIHVRTMKCNSFVHYYMLNWINRSARMKIESLCKPVVQSSLNNKVCSEYLALRWVFKVALKIVFGGNLLLSLFQTIHDKPRALQKREHNKTFWIRSQYLAAMFFFLFYTLN